VLATLGFFGLYSLPLPAKRVWELLYKHQTGLAEVQAELDRLAKMEVVVRRDGLYALADWDDGRYAENLRAVDKRWARIKKYYWLLSGIPFIEHVAVINSVAMGNADHESDIDFFIITRPNRLYFVRTAVIVLFKLLGVYKNRRRVEERFCFGFYISSDRLSIKHLLLSGEDPYLVFWLGTAVPVMGEGMYQRFIKANRWIYGWLPNFNPDAKLEKVRSLRASLRTRWFLESLLSWPAAALEPLLRLIHIRHTFKLPENHWASSSTIATAEMLKLHAIDPRKTLRQRWQAALQSFG